MFCPMVAPVSSGITKSQDTWQKLSSKYSNFKRTEKNSVYLRTYGEKHFLTEDLLCTVFILYIGPLILKIIL